MKTLPGKEVREDILQHSLLARIAAAYFSVGKRLERTTQCSAIRGFILSALRDALRNGTALNQNQIALLLNFDRTVVHRAIKSMVEDGLVSERKAKSGRAIQLRLTPEGRKYHDRLIEARVAADDSLRRQMTPTDRATLLRLLKLVSECKF